MFFKTFVPVALRLAFFLVGLGAMSIVQAGQFFKTTDRVTLHYISNGQGSRALVFVPGWLMPGEVFKHQISGLSDRYRVVVLDPRGQGRSEVKVRDMSAQRRAEDIRELVQHLKLDDYVLVGWSLGVMEILETITRDSMPGLRGLVLVDNSIGMGPPPQRLAGQHVTRPMKPEAFGIYVRDFSRAIFKNPPQDGLLEVVERSARQLKPAVAWRLLDKPHHRDYYKQAVMASAVPLWYAITPRFRAQADELMQIRPRASVTVFEDAGHALFVDRAEAFNSALLEFLSRLD